MVAFFTLEIPGLSLARGIWRRGGRRKVAWRIRRCALNRSDRGIPRLRDPTRHNSARKRKSGRCARDDRFKDGRYTENSKPKSGPPQKATPTREGEAQEKA